MNRNMKVHKIVPFFQALYKDFAPYECCIIT